MWKIIKGIFCNHRRWEEKQFETAAEDTTSSGLYRLQFSWQECKCGKKRKMVAHAEKLGIVPAGLSEKKAELLSSAF